MAGGTSFYSLEDIYQKFIERMLKERVVMTSNSPTTQAVQIQVMTL